MSNGASIDDRQVSRRMLLRSVLGGAGGIILTACAPVSSIGGPTATATAPATRQASPAPTLSASASTATPASPVATETPVPATATPTPAPRTITWWTGSGEAGWLAAANSVAEKIGAAVDGLTVTVSGGHDDFGKIVVGIASGKAPDFLDVGTLEPYAARGILRKLGPYAAASPSVATNYLPAMWANGSWNGDQYGVPALDHGPELGLIWNQALTGGRLTQTNLPKTWDDLLTLGASMSARDSSGAIQTLGFDPLDGVGGLLDTARDLTGHDWYSPQSQTVDLANAQYTALLHDISAYYSTIGSSQLAQFRQDVPSLSADATAGICSGRQLAMVSGYWSVGDVSRLRGDPSWNYAATWVPTQQAGGRVQRLAGRTIAIPEAAGHPDDAWASIRILIADESNAIFLQRAGRFASTRSFLKSSTVRQYPFAPFFVDSVDQATNVTGRETNPVAGFAQAKWDQAIQQIVGGTVSVEDALAAAQKSTAAEMARLAK